MSKLEALKKRYEELGDILYATEEEMREIENTLEEMK